MKPNPKKKSQKSNPKSPTESPISEIPVVSPYANDSHVENSRQIFTIDDMIDVWCRGVTNGATLWQYCQEHKKELPSSFEKGLLEISKDIRESNDRAKALEALVNNNMLLLGIFDEKINTSL